MFGRVRVFGPAYLDRVLRVSGPLPRGPQGAPLDQSVDGRAEFGASAGLTLVDPVGSSIAIELPGDWPAPRGLVTLASEIAGPDAGHGRVVATDWHDDLGGMGAGFAAAMGGELVTSLGPEGDPIREAVLRRLGQHGIPVVSIPSLSTADWTLLVSSGAHGDKLAVGFRGGFASIRPEACDLAASATAEVLIVAGAPNRLAGPMLRAPGPRLRVLAPAMRNMIDRKSPLLRMIAPVDVLTCNLPEWESLEDREEVAARLSILVVTEGAAGSSVRFTTPDGSSGRLRVPAFPRRSPPRDTNRAGEAFAAFFCSTLLERGWRPESCTIEADLVREAMMRASAAAALTLDRLRFGFPTAAEVDVALSRGIVDGSSSSRYDEGEDVRPFAESGGSDEGSRGRADQ